MAYARQWDVGRCEIFLPGSRSLPCKHTETSLDIDLQGRTNNIFFVFIKCILGQSSSVSPSQAPKQATCIILYTLQK